MTATCLNIGLVAHDAMKATLLDWVTRNKSFLEKHNFYATGTTWKVLTQVHTDMNIKQLKSGPMGGDQQLGALICDGKLNVLIFFQDPMTTQPHDVDVKALVRMSTLYDIPLACNPATADLIIANSSFSNLARQK